MTKEEKIIATAFTGKMFIDGSDMGLLYEYMEKKVGHGNNYWPETEFCINGRYLEMNDNWNSLYEISLKSLEKLPKEDEK